MAVIGDGSMTAGLAYEGLNQAGGLGQNLVVVLNDNEMSISRNVGALSSFLSRKLSSALGAAFQEGSRIHHAPDPQDRRRSGRIRPPQQDSLKASSLPACSSRLSASPT